jgi:3-deoxy-D-manno-octulosonic-acid transferase
MNRSHYSLLLYLLLPLIVVKLLWRGMRSPDYLKRWGERFGLYRGDSPKIQVWLHAVSVGEFIAAVPLIRSLLEEIPADQLLITTTTPTGSARVKAEFGDALHHVYLPYDLPGAVRRFLRHYQPELGVVMETEIWPNLFHACSHQQTTLVLANVRLSQRSLEGYQRWAGQLAAEALQQVAWAAVQGEPDRQRLIELGIDVDKVQVTGSIKFDLTLPIDISQHGEALRSELGSERPVWIAASTREGEESQVLDAHRKLLQKIPDALLILVPRHPERFNAVAKQANAANLRMVRRSEGSTCNGEVQLYLGDTMGEMLLLYAASDVAFVGGSLVPTGSHNMLEPAALGKPVLFGPHRYNFAEISQLLIDQKAAQEVADSTVLSQVVVELLQNRELRLQQGGQGKAVVEQNRGALKRMSDKIQTLLAL